MKTTKDMIEGIVFPDEETANRFTDLLMAVEAGVLRMKLGSGLDPWEKELVAAYDAIAKEDDS